jgi:hypothetical protein
MPCEHNFGIIENFDKQKAYDNLDEFDVFPDVFPNALKAYGCANINDDALNDWWPRIENMAVYWHTYSRPGKALARYGVTLIPPESLDLFYSIVKDNTQSKFSEQAAAVLAVIDKAKRNGKYVIHFGI